MTKPHTRDLSAARPRGCASVSSSLRNFNLADLIEVFPFNPVLVEPSLVLLGEGVA
ncbi:hypothetical protein OB962_03390 [Aeromonas piscicola]|jgi:hypothetical protein|uniref:Uncharacterized protein n=1 Tax=Aeromonas piscicola TaxID=600645 RepID=A0ABT7Q7X9_9GAMM|nr:MULTISPECIES: hypothetical protein [Aeromonas]MDM5130048.1 hypothetical protein [Aeromonas piscicola]